MKALADIKLSCETENVISTFAKRKLLLKHSSYKLKLQIARLVMETEMQNKHLEKKKLKKDMEQTLAGFDIM